MIRIFLQKVLLINYYVVLQIFNAILLKQLMDCVHNYCDDMINPVCDNCDGLTGTDPGRLPTMNGHATTQTYKLKHDITEMTSC